MKHDDTVNKISQEVCFGNVYNVNPRVDHQINAW